MCANCGEAAYCDAQCQKKDWKKHKPNCGDTDRIDLKSFYPLIAALMEYHRQDPSRPVHPALRHEIVSSPNPGAHPCAFPDGSSALLVFLGAPMPQARALSQPGEWWPSAINRREQDKLIRRFQAEFYLLPSIIACLFGIVAEVYSTAYTSPNAADKKHQRRVRLKYGSSPIADFGIVKGRADVKAQDRFAYFSMTDAEFIPGMDPNDHYWMYFTTAAGEDIFLDCGMSTYNFDLGVETKTHVKRALPSYITIAPAFLMDREIKRAMPNLLTESERFSVLRDAKLEGAIRHIAGVGLTDSDADILWEFMDKVAGRECSEVEKELVGGWCMKSCGAFERCLDVREYLNFPAETVILVPNDTEGPPSDDPAWWKYLGKMNRKQRRGEITNEELGEAILAWKRKHAGMARKSA